MTRNFCTGLGPVSPGPHRPGGGYYWKDKTHDHD